MLIASYFRGFSTWLRKRTGWNSKITLSLSIFITLALAVGFFWLVGAKVSQQMAELEDNLPTLFEKVEKALNGSTIGHEIVEKGNEVRQSEDMATYISRFFATTFGFLGDIYIILIIGVFFTASPYMYKSGIIQLVPPKRREKANDVFEKLASGLKKWLAAKFLAMLAVFILTAIGLIILDIPMWLALALLAGLLNFVPNFGPLAAAIPAVLVALAISPSTALWVAGLYLVVQLLESSLINPQAQHHLIKIPPALIIISQLLVGSLTGIWGVIFATPLVLVIIILVQELYINQLNKNKEQQETAKAE
ncbi:AI-2E family transporter [Antarcticibacterium sp. 1MA-6-2]|uniref:AI-2E family transporter n=1 Tax=Antarcticibacterium sp. 1MA-6-2 TaxID=2908210 RepID=UPI001F31B947|nr:AI-2E family transporter [Antarcticibacterium sp. 1MA-6-2]UJH90822.1 AI-2E family transporter [Antarcticibacterium sp. 1MA-6-2]